jgi:hypothetical protein
MRPAVQPLERATPRSPGQNIACARDATVRPAQMASVVCLTGDRAPPLLVLGSSHRRAGVLRAGLLDHLPVFKQLGWNAFLKLHLAFVSVQRGYNQRTIQFQEEAALLSFWECQVQGARSALAVLADPSQRQKFPQWDGADAAEHERDRAYLCLPGFRAGCAALLHRTVFECSARHREAICILAVDARNAAEPWEASPTAHPPAKRSPEDHAGPSGGKVPRRDEGDGGIAVDKAGPGGMGAEEGSSPGDVPQRGMGAEEGSSPGDVPQRGMGAEEGSSPVDGMGAEANWGEGASGLALNRLQRQVVSAAHAGNNVLITGALPTPTCATPVGTAYLDTDSACAFRRLCWHWEIFYPRHRGVCTQRN